MTKSQAFPWKTACWIAIGGFTSSSAWFGWSMHQIFVDAAQPGSMGLMCGNSVTDPLGAILSLGPPVGFGAVVGLAVLSNLGFANRWSIASASFLLVGCTTALLVFGIGFFRDGLPGFLLSDIVWWLKPFGPVFGV